MKSRLSPDIDLWVQLFAGRPSLKKLSLWADDGVFEDPITVATGRKQYEPQWVGFRLRQSGSTD